MQTQTARPRRVSVEWVALWVILVLAFAMSFRALYDVGQAAGLGSLSWALPVIVDGFAVLAARVIERLDSKWARLYPWALLIALVGVSSWWNALHAGGEVVLSPWQAYIVAGAPPVILGLAYHLLRMVEGAQERAARKEAQRAAAAQTRAEKRAAKAATAPADRATVTVETAPERATVGAPTAPAALEEGAPSAPAARRGTVKERAWEWYQEQRTAGQEPTAPELARATGTSPGNARKLVPQFDERWTNERRAQIRAVGADQ